MRIKSLIIALIVLLITGVVFAENTTNNNASSNNSNEKVEVNFYPETFNVENNDNMEIQLGASHGWESVSLRNKENLRYISMFVSNKDSTQYIFMKDRKENYVWMRNINIKIKDLLENSKLSFSTKIENRILDKIDIYTDIKDNKIEKSFITNCTDVAYVPFSVDCACQGTFYALVIKDNKILYILKGILNNKSILYSNSSYINNFNENSSEWNEYVNICAYSLKEIQNSRIPTLGNTDNFSFYLKKYLKELDENNYPVFGNEYKNEAKNNSFEKYREISNSEGIQIANAAKRYLNWAVEYNIGRKQFKVKIKDDVNNVWGDNPNYINKELNYWPKEENEFPTEKKGIDGNPIPYVAGGLDTPRTFWKKMQIAENKKNQSFQPGSGKNNFKYAGTDSLGFFTGVIAMTSLDSRIYGLKERFSQENKPAEMLNQYSKMVEQLITDKKYESYKDTEQETVLNKELHNKVCFTWKDIDFITKVVPSFDNIRVGDFLICENEGIGRVAVVIKVSHNVTIAESIDIVYIDESERGTAVKETNLTNLGNYSARRLIVYEKDAKNNCLFDVLDNTPDPKLSTITITNKYEATQENKEENWRFIPNTGEYLILDGIKVEFKNSYGIDLLKLYGTEKYKLRVVAKDRDYNQSNNTASEGNIYKNKAETFDVAIIHNNDDINKKENYKQKYTLSAKEIEFTESETKIKERQYDSKAPLNVSLTDSGSLMYKIKNNDTYDSVCVGIRPESSAKAFPGDDLIIGFDVFDDKENSLSKVWSNEEDYIAVYDKKMLWRANLYIEETSNDWNNKHPWNVPAEGTNGGPVWWDGNGSLTAAQRWGNNEWNRSYTFNSITQQMEFGKGEGRQVVNLPEYSSYRTNGNNVLQTVSYDYPGKYVNAWDSPFDFIYKMNEQKKSIAKHFTGEVNNINNSSLSDEKKKEQLNEAGKFPNGNATISENTITVSFLSNWGRTTAPNDKWKFYWKQIDSNTNMEPYIPGLGMNIEHKNYKYTGETEAFISTMNFPAKLSAGADCLGFVKRTSYYRGNGYSWSSNTMQYDRAEGNLTPDEEGERNSNGLAYPGSYSTKIISREEISNIISDYKKNFSEEDITENELKKFNTIKQKFMKIIPGDVIYYGSSHIGEIKSVNYNAIENANTIYEIMNAVSVTESVYNGTLFNVTVRTLLQGQPNQTTSTAQAGSWHLDSDSNIRNWQIRRLTK